MVPTKHSKEELKIILKNYKSSRELIIDNFEIYCYIAQAGHRVRELAPHFSSKKSLEIKWNRESIMEHINDCFCFTQFRYLYPQAVKTARKLGILEEVREEYLPREKKKFKIYTEESILKIAQGCDTFRDFTKNWPGPYQQAYQQGWVPVIKNYFEQKLINSFIEDEVITLALSCENLRAFVRMHPKETQFLRIIKRYNHLETLFKEKKNKKRSEVRHVRKINNPKKQRTTPININHNLRYSDQDLFEKAALYISRKDFQTNDKGAYEAAWRRGLLDQVCVHMTARVFHNQELVREVFQSIFKQDFPTVKPDFLINPKTNRKMELDGYCKKLKMAFEYNGPHHDPESKYYTAGVQEKDALKVKICKELGIKLFVFKEHHPKDLNKELMRVLKLDSLPKVKIKAR